MAVSLTVNRVAPLLGCSRRGRPASLFDGRKDDSSGISLGVRVTSSPTCRGGSAADLMKRHGGTAPLDEAVQITRAGAGRAALRPQLLRAGMRGREALGKLPQKSATK